MSGEHNRESIIRIADAWLDSHRVSESWRIINMLRDELVRTGQSKEERSE